MQFMETNNTKTKQILKVAAAALTLPLLASCSSMGSGKPPASKSAAEQGKEKASSRDTYVPSNDVEGDNYNKRLKISDDPSTIIWCTFGLSDAAGSPLVTVPIAGKLTSGNKRPYSTEEIVSKGSLDTKAYLVVEKPGPDGMYGSSNRYSYGFTPGGDLWQFNGQQPVCTTEPTVYQRQATTMILETDEELSQATAEAEKLLAAGDTEAAQNKLEDVLKGDKEVEDE